MYLIELDVHSVNETFCGSYIQIYTTHMSNGKKAAISAISFRFYFKKWILQWHRVLVTWILGNAF